MMLAHGFLVLTAGVGDGPVDVRHARDVGALLAATQRDGHGAGRDGVPRQQRGLLAGGVQAELLQHVGDLGVDVVAGLGAGRQCDDASSRVVLGEHAADDGAAAVADAREDDLRGDSEWWSWGHSRGRRGWRRARGKNLRAQRLT